jgi:hypothetical protein
MPNTHIFTPMHARPYVTPVRRPLQSKLEVNAFAGPADSDTSSSVVGTVRVSGGVEEIVAHQIAVATQIVLLIWAAHAMYVATQRMRHGESYVGKMCFSLFIVGSAYLSPYLVHEVTRTSYSSCGLF